MKLAFDLGQHLGYGLFTDEGQFVASETIGLGCGRGSIKTPCQFCGPPDRRKTFELRAMQKFEELICAGDVTEVAYEKVSRHSAVAAAHVYGGLQAMMLANCQRREIRCTPVHVSTWKSRCGVKGGGKDAYVERMNELFKSSLTLVNEDEIAARGIGYAAFTNPK